MKGHIEVALAGHFDSDFARDKLDRKSSSIQIFFLGDTPITWPSRKQKIFALSLCEAEYISMTSIAYMAEFSI